MFFSSTKQHQPSAHPVSTSLPFKEEKQSSQVHAIAFACNAHLVFYTDKEVKEWVSVLLQRFRPGMALSPTAKVEPIVGYPLHKPGVRANLYDLLHFMISKAGIAPEPYEFQFIEIGQDDPPMQVWCVAAVQPTMQ